MMIFNLQLGTFALILMLCVIALALIGVYWQKMHDDHAQHGGHRHGGGRRSWPDRFSERYSK